MFLWAGILFNVLMKRLNSLCLLVLSSYYCILLRYLFCWVGAMILVLFCSSVLKLVWILQL